jgi:hypothetical protein
MDKNISITIMSVCKKYNIPYESVNFKHKDFCNDAIRLGEIYKELQLILGDLLEIEERHNVNGLGELLKDDILQLETIEHDIIKIANKIRKEE